MPSTKKRLSLATVRGFRFIIFGLVRLKYTSGICLLFVCFLVLSAQCMYVRSTRMLLIYFRPSIHTNWEIVNSIGVQTSGKGLTFKEARYNLNLA